MLYLLKEWESGNMVERKGGRLPWSREEATTKGISGIAE